MCDVMKYMEISKMLTISTTHISLASADLLDTKEERMETGLVVYEKGNYGWFIHVDEFFELDATPEDIMNCIFVAKQNNCEWLCLDRDGETIDGLPVYDW